MAGLEPKTENRRKSEARKPKWASRPPALRISDFGFPSDFGFRASDLSSNAAWGHAAYKRAPLL